MKNKKFRIFSKQLNFKKLLFVVMVAGLAIIGVQNYTDNSSKAAGWTFDSIQGNRIDSTNNPGGYLNNAPSISPDNGTNFSPAFGNSVGSAVTINGSGFPTPDFNINAKEVQSGEGYSCYLSNVPDSWLYCWGKNDVGYLGDGTNIHRASPVPISRGQISQNETITTFALGYRHACVVTDLNKTYCWGVNLYGALGIGTASGNYNTPQLVQAGDLPSGDYFKSINLGFLYSCAISNEDEAYCWGWNDVGQLGLGFTYPTAVHTPRKVKTISDEASYVMPNAVKQISASYQSTCAVANDDSVYCWGSNNYGQLGDNTTDNKSAPVKVYGMSGVAFAKVETGGDFTCALNNNNQIYCWGHNSYGQLGNGTNNNSSVPIAVVGGIAFKEIGSSEHTGIFGTICAISVIDEPYCWGSLYTGSGLWSDASSPTKVKTTSGGGTMPDTVISISTSTGSGSSDGCAVATDSKVYCWGYGYPNTYFVLGNNSYNDSREPIPVVQFGEVPKIYFDDIYGLECQSVIVISPSQLRCIIVVGLAQGLHDVVVGYNGENKTLPQSYMYKTIPNAPTGVTAVGKNKIVHLEWQWQDEKPYIDSASFYIECKRSDAAVWRDVSVYGCDTGKQGMPSLLAKSTNSGTADIYGLENGVVYDFRIRSYANSTYSDYVFLYNQVPQASIYVPSQPIIASSTASGTNATINWQAPASDGGSPVTGYMVMAQCAAYSSGGTMVQTAMQTYQVSTTSLTISSCLNAVNPTKISVIASNANGASEPSGAVELWATAALKPPSIPSNIKVNNVNTDQTMLSWTAPSNNGSAITQYEVRYSILPDFSDWTGTVGVDTCVSSTPAPPTTSCVSNSLTLGSQYYFQVRATNANGASDWSVIHASVVGAPDRPIISTISTTTINSATSSIYLAWNAPNDNGAAITNYRLEYSTDPTFPVGNTTSVNTGTTTNYTLNPATNGALYYFRVLATNSRGDSPYSDPVQAIPYAPPSNLSINPNQGFVMGGDLTTISGDNLNGTTSVTIGGNPCKTFVVIDSHTINCLTPEGTIGAQDVVVTNLGGSATVTGGYTYGTPSLSMVIDHGIDIVVANPGSGTVASSHGVTVKTDNPTGYQLNLSMSGANQNLESNGVSLSSTNASSTAMALPTNSWGHSVIDANNHWTSVPISTYPKQIKKTTTPTTGGMSGAGDTTQVFYGVNVDITQRAGKYQGSVLYTAVVDY